MIPWKLIRCRRFVEENKVLLQNYLRNLIIPSNVLNFLNVIAFNDIIDDCVRFLHSRPRRDNWITISNF